MAILITLCARGGSKGIPGKNIKPIHGKPLIAYSIAVAYEFAGKYDADVTLSTDDSGILSVASHWGLSSTYKRPDRLATDTAGKIDVIADVLKHEEQRANQRYDYIIDLDITSPLRTCDDLSAAYAQFLNDPNALTLFSVNTANRNPYFNMVEQQTNGYFSLVKNSTFLTRQSAPKVYDLNASFYFYRRFFFDLHLVSCITDRSMIYPMPHVCFDLDHPIDFEFMEYLMAHEKLGFTL